MNTPSPDYPKQAHNGHETQQVRENSCRRVPDQTIKIKRLMETSVTRENLPEQKQGGFADYCCSVLVMAWINASLTTPLPKWRSATIMMRYLIKVTSRVLLLRSVRGM